MDPDPEEALRPTRAERQLLGFAATMALFLGLLSAWLGWTLGRGLPPAGRLVLDGLLAAVYLSTLAHLLVLRARAAGPAVRALAWVGGIGMGWWSLLFVGTVLLELGRVGWLTGRAAWGAAGTPAAGGAPALAVLAAATLLTALGLVAALRPPRLVEVEVPVAGLPPELDGLRVVHLSDLHVSATLGRRRVAAVVARVNALEPDLVALTGDLVDGSVDALREDAAPLRDLRARLGVFFVPGNHEYYAGVEAWLAEARRLGMRTLLNAHVVVEAGGARLVVAGVPDHRAAAFVPSHRPDPARALAGAPEGAPRLLLAHQPRSADAALAAGADLVLCGHTHGGQFWPWSWLVPRVEPYAVGLHRVGAAHVFTSRGTGWWGPPNRLGAPAEIALIRLRPAGEVAGG